MNAGEIGGRSNGSTGVAGWGDMGEGGGAKPLFL